MRYNARVFSLLGQSGSIFGISLLDQVQTRKNLLVLSADMSTTAGLDKFKAKYPDRFVNVGIAEQNMIGIAAGLTDEGWKTVSVTQACFISMRCFEQIRQYCGYMGGKQIIVGLASGFSLSFLGNTHYALEDIALMRTIPGMTVIAAADAMEAVKIFEAALDENHPVYIRLYGGTNTPVVYSSNFEYKIGKAIKLKDGNDIQLVATGSMVSHALNVSKALEKEGIKASVVDMHTIKPLDTSVIDLNAKLIVTLEEHFTTGGLGSAVADFLSEEEEHPALYKIGVNDSFSVVGDYEFLMKSNHLDDESIIDTIMGQLKGGK